MKKSDYVGQRKVSTLKCHGTWWRKAYGRNVMARIWYLCCGINKNLQKN